MIGKFVSAAGVLALGACVAALPSRGGARDVPRDAKPGEAFIVHEWGTFSTFSGSDGAQQKFYPDDRDLPGFVHSQKRYIKGGLENVYVSLETPVLYFYTGRERTASVRVDFPKGQMTEWYPQVSRPGVGWRTLDWQNVRITPSARPAFASESGERRYYAARETDAAPLQVAGDEGRIEHEKFLFYRGVGNFTMPLTVRAMGHGSLKVRNTGRDALPAFVLLRVEGGKVRFRLHDHLSPGTEAEVEEPAEGSTVEKLGAAMTELLTRQGLYEKEARAMVKTWRSAWFDEDGTRVLYLVPTSLTDELLPLRITPRPDTLVRVLVGRHDVLTPEREREIDALVKKLEGGSNAEARQADAALKQLGRYRHPAQTAASARLKRGEAR